LKEEQERVQLHETEPILDPILVDLSLLLNPLPGTASSSTGSGGRRKRIPKNFLL
jgi:hypothetical protein